MRTRLAPLALLALAACGKGEAPTSKPATSAATTATAAATAPEASRIDAILAAEHRRDASGVTEADQQSREVAVRRAAARALARIGGAGSRPGLLRALADEDDEVVAWAAYGLGFFCKGQEKATVSALAARFVARLGGPAPAEGSLDPLAAIARAVGRCGAEESEPTLVAWLAGPPAQATAAAFGLGELGSAKQKLREETLVALLNLAAGSAASPPLPEALFPVGRLEHLPPSVLDRVREVATARLGTPGDARLFAVRALSRSGDGAVPELARVLTTAGTFTASERAEAARGLGKRGKHGQRALAAAVSGLVPANDPIALATLVGEDFGVLTTVLETLTDGPAAKAALDDLSALQPPPGAPPTLVRRVSMLRCHAARLLATPGEQDKRLLACDLTSPSAGIGARAMVAVLGKAEITGHRLALWRDLVQKGDIRAREAALELLEEHEEIEGAAAVLAEALAAKESGIVGTAAEVLTKQPQRAVAEAPAKKPAKKAKKKKEPAAAPEARAPSPAIVKALLDALARPATLEDPEAADAIVDAVGALALKEAKPRLDDLCRSPYPTTREHVEKAIALVSGEKKTCEPPPGGGPAPEELGHLVRAPAKLSLDTDAGALEMILDPARAPVAVTRFVDLAKAGFYDGMVVHRVVPGFVAQFGAPFGDGFGGPPGKPALRCETSPLPFGPLAVGVALAGRDTGSSQLFVMHGRHPHLDGGYALVGKASGPWAALAEGDVIRKVKITP
jgi:cyclophilin family peptidyl-prolyl cis-trans isomerase